MPEPRLQYWVDRPLEITIEGDSTRRISLPQPFALVGSDERCDVVLNDTGLPARCFFACVTESGLSGATLAHPRSNVARSFIPINVERGVRFGRRRLKFSTTPDAIIASAESEFDGQSHEKTHYIRWTDGGRKRFTRLRAGRALLLGRAAPSVIQIRDHSISSVHAVIYHDGHALWVIDLNSTNGTFVKDRRVRCGHVFEGQTFRVGSTQIRFGRDKSRTYAKSSVENQHPSTSTTICTPLTGNVANLTTSQDIEVITPQTDAVESSDVAVQAGALDVADKIEHNDTSRSDRHDQTAMKSAISELAERLAETEQQLTQQQALIANHEAAQSDWESRQADLVAKEKQLEDRAAELEKQAVAVTEQQQAIETRQQELEKHQAGLDRRMDEFAELQRAFEAKEAELEQRATELEHRMEEVKRIERELESQETKSTTEKATLADELAQSQAEFEQRVAEQTAAIYEEQKKMDDAYAQLTHDRNELERCSRDVALQLKQTKMELKQRAAELHRENELLVVNRIRTRRGLEAREAAVVASEREMERRKEALLALEQRVQRQQEEFIARQRRYVPPEEGLVRSPVQVNDQRPTSSGSLLESADFTELLQDFISKRK